MNIGVVVQARVGSTRMPGKILKPFHDGRTILQIITSRLIRNRDNWPVIIATTTNSLDDEIAELAAKIGVDCYRGSEEDVLQRFIDTAKHFDLQRLVRVCTDNPFFELQALEDLVSACNETSDYCSYALAGQLPAIKSHLGLYGEVVTTNALIKASESTQDPFYHEHVTNYIYENPESFHVELIPAPQDVFTRTDLRFTSDTQADFSMLQTIYEELYEDHADNISTTDLVTYVDQRPEFLAGMAEQIESNSKS